ncbi:MAG: Carbamoyl-phosphate synthase small chain [Owenweeksia sp. TMED14]|nr:MAG: Carbamoyl-phosphate synthase small chain [Owenweeksia sp. TMED14]|tara:strand:- start:2639 stop:3733 length:1095 start_codon:yes stop_codon:yes gene_type:complete
MKKKAFVLLEDGTIFHGSSIGLDGTVTGEICFNTGMSGYQEIFTDPSYKGQLMVTANVHIGNYGIADEDSENDQVQISGLIMRNFSEFQSRPRSNGKTLKELLKANDIVAISDVDTRALVKHIRNNGSQNALISTRADEISSLRHLLDQTPSMVGLELCSHVSTVKRYSLGDENSDFKIVALDLGIKKSILSCLVNLGCHIIVFPYDTSFKTLHAENPDGYFLSNGPGDPSASPKIIEIVKQIIVSGIPTFGICLGHQMIALASGLTTYKMHNGHRGINHPVKNLLTGKGEITSQNHGFAVSMKDLESISNVELTHIHLNDETVAGISRNDFPVFSVQYHPEASPGPHDSHYLFQEFIDLIKSK